LPIKRVDSGQHLVQDQPQGVQIGASVGRLAYALLGCHVLGSAEYRAVSGKCLQRLLSAGDRPVYRYLGESEVEHFDEVVVALAVDQHDVFGLEITVTCSSSLRRWDLLSSLRGEARWKRIHRNRRAVMAA
jgi:hypothetical protein